jgi:hypothetical protein
MKVISYTALHYSADYLAYALRSVIDHVDEAWVLYSATGSHGHSTDLVCPDHAKDLYDIAQQAAGDKLRWYTASPGQWAHEGMQREFIHQLVPDADVILVLDADEVWSDGLAEFAVDATTSAGFRDWRLPIIHYWRSFHRCVTEDPAYPIRVICPKRDKGDAVYLEVTEPIHHFGYAQRSEIVHYKLTTHGHKNELRPDWYETRWLPNVQTDCHPVGSEYWNPEQVDPYMLGLPVWMKDHPFAQLEVIP